MSVVKGDTKHSEFWWYRCRSFLSVSMWLFKIMAILRNKTSMTPEGKAQSLWGGRQQAINHVVLKVKVSLKFAACCSCSSCQSRQQHLQCLHFTPNHFDCLSWCGICFPKLTKSPQEITLWSSSSSVRWNYREVVHWELNSGPVTASIKKTFRAESIIVWQRTGCDCWTQEISQSRGTSEEKAGFFWRLL